MTWTRKIEFFDLLVGEAEFVRAASGDLSSRFTVSGTYLGDFPVVSRSGLELAGDAWFVEAVDAASGAHVWLTCGHQNLAHTTSALETWCARQLTSPVRNPYQGSGRRFEPGGDLARLRDEEKGRRGPNTEYEREVAKLVRDGALVVVSHSGGKDSQAMLYRILRMGVPVEQIVLIHAPLKGVEWAGIPEHIDRTSPRGIPLLFAETRASATQEQKARGEFGTGEERWLLERVLERRMFPSMSKSQGRWCTSDFKIGPIKREAKEYARALGFKVVVDAVGLRAEETSDRAAQKSLQVNEHASTKDITYYDWHPIKWLTTEEVFDTIREEGFRPMYTYAEGMTRCSCSFCIYLDPPDMRKAAELAPDLYAAYVALERHIGHTVKTRSERHTPSERLELATRGNNKLARSADRVLARYGDDDLAQVMRKKEPARSEKLAKDAGISKSEAEAIGKAWREAPSIRTLPLSLEEFTGVRADPKLVRQIMRDIEAYEKDIVERRGRQAQILPIRVSPFRRVKYAGEKLYEQLRRERGDDLYTIRCDAPCVEENPDGDDEDYDDYDEEEDYDPQLEDFGEFLRGYEDWTVAELAEFLTLDRQRDGIEHDRIVTPTGKVLHVIEHDDRFVVEQEPDGKLSSMEAGDFLDAISFSPDRVWEYISEPDFNRDFWEHPIRLYHGTSKEAWEWIRRGEGLQTMSESRGIGNRSTGAAVFTHPDPEYVIEYGEVLIEIDTAAMKRDGFEPRVAREEGKDEEDATEALARLIGVEDFVAEGDSSLHPDTVVVFASIPTRYLSRSDK